MAKNAVSGFIRQKPAKEITMDAYTQTLVVANDNDLNRLVKLAIEQGISLTVAEPDNIHRVVDLANELQELWEESWESSSC